MQQLLEFYFRTFETSVKDLLLVPSWETLSRYWKEEILTEVHSVWKKDPRELCGVLLDPKEFFPSVMLRFLMARELEGHPLAPGVYSILKKLGSDGGRHNWFRWMSGKELIVMIEITTILY